MPWGRYFNQARIIGESIGIRTIERNVWGEVGRSCFMKKEDSLENMKEK